MSFSQSLLRDIVRVQQIPAHWYVHFLQGAMLWGSQPQGCQRAASVILISFYVEFPTLRASEASWSIHHRLTAWCHHYVGKTTHKSFALQPRNAPHVSPRHPCSGKCMDYVSMCQLHCTNGSDTGGTNKPVTAREESNSLNSYWRNLRWQYAKRKLFST